MRSASASDELRPPFFAAFISTEITAGAAVTLLLRLQKSASKCQPRPRRNVIQPPAEYGMRSGGLCPALGAIPGPLMRTDTAAASCSQVMMSSNLPPLMTYAAFFFIPASLKRVFASERFTSCPR